MNDNNEVSDTRTMAVLKMSKAVTEAEKRRAEAEKRSAAVTLIGAALTITGWTEQAEAAGTWDKAAAVAEARDALDTAGLRAAGESQPMKHPGCSAPIVNYERPGH